MNIQNSPNFLYAVLFLVISVFAASLLKEILALAITRKKSSIYVTFLANLLTTPLIVALLSVFATIFSWSGPNLWYYVVLAALETAAVFVESGVFVDMELTNTKKTSFLFSLALNAAASVAIIAIASLVASVTAA